MMDLIKKEGILLHVLIGLLVAASSQAADAPEEDVATLKLKIHELENRIRHMCEQFHNLPPNCSAPEIHCKECPDGWLHAEGQCFLFSHDKDTFSNSSHKCEEQGAHLAILTKKEQREALEEERKRIGGFDTHYWIGLTDSENEGEWKWVDNSTLLNPFWTETEPDDHGISGEDCAVLAVLTRVLSDVPCNFHYPRICQKDPTLRHNTTEEAKHSDDHH